MLFDDLLTGPKSLGLGTLTEADDFSEGIFLFNIGGRSEHLALL